MPTKSLRDGFVLIDPYIYHYYHQNWFALTVNIYLLRIERKLAEEKKQMIDINIKLKFV
jgi:hypothetical protein